MVSEQTGGARDETLGSLNLSPIVKLNANGYLLMKDAVR